MGCILAIHVDWASCSSSSISSTSFYHQHQLKQQFLQLHNCRSSYIISWCISSTSWCINIVLSSPVSAAILLQHNYRSNSINSISWFVNSTSFSSSFNSTSWCISSSNSCSSFSSTTVILVASAAQASAAVPLVAPAAIVFASAAQLQQQFHQW